MKTRHFSVSEIEAAANLLRSGELVAFPTETVYGLGANAMSEDSVQKIFDAKGRPSDNPLIVHIAAISQLSFICRDVPRVASLLMDRLWPGPLTIVLPKRAEVPDQVTAGLDTVAVRLPDHSIALELIKHAGVPVAAPSANRSGRPSATTWQAVAEDLDGRIAGLILGEPTTFGLESTVVDATCHPPRVLRPGSLSLEQLQIVCPSILPFSKLVVNDGVPTVNSPGLKYKHYKPVATVLIVTAETAHCMLTRVSATNTIAHYIGVNHPIMPSRFSVIRVCSDLHEYGAVLFDFYRKADLSNADTVCCEAVKEVGIGVALMDRMQRASQ